MCSSLQSGNPDLNRGPQVPQTCTLNQLRYCPNNGSNFWFAAPDMEVFYCTTDGPDCQCAPEFARGGR